MSYTHDPLAEAVRETESEIFNEAAEAEPAAADDFERGPEQSDGWEGALDPAELAATNIYGHTLTGQPLKLAEEQNEFEKMQAELNAARRVIQQLDPQIQAQRDSQRYEQEERFNKWQIDALGKTPQENMEELQNFRQAAVKEGQEIARVDSSLSAAAEAHGEKFQAAYAELQRVGANEKTEFGFSPTVQRVWQSPDSGRALMDWHNNGGAGPYRSASNPPPFMPGQRHAAPRSSGEWGERGSSVLSNEEEDVFAYGAQE